MAGLTDSDTYRLTRIRHLAGFTDGMACHGIGGVPAYPIWNLAGLPDTDLCRLTGYGTLPAHAHSQAKCLAVLCRLKGPCRLTIGP